MNQNNGNHRVATAELIEEENPEQLRTTFYDANNPELRPPRSIDVRRRKSWKRRLVGSLVVLLLIGGGIGALYLLMRVNRVDVKVHADSPPTAQNAKSKNDSPNSENGLTAEAINIARNATGADTAATNSADPTASPTASPSLAINNGRNLSFTLDSSPVTEVFNDGNSDGSASQRSNNNTVKPSASSSDLSTMALSSRANPTTSIFIDDTVSKPSHQSQTTTSVPSRIDRKTGPATGLKTPAAVLPPFGTMLPVRTQGVLFTVRNNSYARLELTRDCSGMGWSLPKGTVLIGRTSGSEHDRAFVNVIGYIDPRDNRLVKMTGEALGADGATGIPGKRIGVDRNRLKETLRKVASSGVQVAGTMVGALTGRGTVVIDSAGYRLINPISNEARAALGGNEQRNFVKVMAGQPAYVMVADLPKSVQTVDAPGEDEILRVAGSLSDREVMELVLFGSPDEVHAALPLMTEEQKRLVTKTLAPEN
jgi:hypothetical protein